MDWSDEGIVLSARPHGETGLVVSLLTREHGRHAGFVPGGDLAARQSGLAIRQCRRGRLARTSVGATRQLHGRTARAACCPRPGRCGRAGRPVRGLRRHRLRRCPNASRIRRCSTASAPSWAALGHPGWPAIYVRLELGLLQELGFGLDLEKCAATGSTDRPRLRLARGPGAPCRRDGRGPLQGEAAGPAGISIHWRIAGR